MTSRIPLLLCLALTLQAHTYYLDSQHGDDSRVGTAADVAWKTLEKASSRKLGPGDRLLLKSGSTWTGQLAPQGAGSESAPIIIDRYGEGPLPRIDAAGQ